ncbi:hypothetical protein LCGC14_2630350, partial [marine sediment metagenome]
FKGDTGGETATDWIDAEDTNITQAKNSNFRIRIHFHESGNAAGDVTPLLEYKTASGNACANTTGWTTITTATTNAFALVDSSQFVEAVATTEQLSSFGGIGFVAGELLDQTNPGTIITIGAKNESEYVWNMKATDNAVDGTAYIFRVSNNGTNLTNYNACPQVTVPAGNAPPVVSNVALDGGTAITLTENTTKAVSATADVSDPNGADDIISATSTIYRSGVGAGCTADDENCYKIASCTFSGATSTVTCTANIQFFADPTDASSTAYSAQDWQAEITVTDSASATGASSTLSGVELNTLWAIDITATINYGAVSPTADTGSTNQSVTVTNTGNAAIDIEASGTDITLGGSTIGVANQKYATSTFTYSSCTICTALSSTPAAYEVDLLKPTSATPVTDLIYWGLAVPNGTAQGVHSGTNTFTAIGD